MIVRLRFRTGPPIRKSAGKNRHVAAAMAVLMWPGVFIAYVLAVWALAAQLRLAGAFAIADGVFSHWQVWLASALSLHLGALTLNRYGQTGRIRSGDRESS